jgi:hypothetical protein
MPAPPLLEAVNRNSLAVFLLVRFFPLPLLSPSICVLIYVYAGNVLVGVAPQANVATGVVNLSMRTMYASNGRAMWVLGVYAFGVCAFAWAMRRRRVWKL